MGFKTKTSGGLIMKKIIISLCILAVMIFAAGCTAQSAEFENVVKRTPVSVEKVNYGSISEKYYGIGQLYADEEFEIFTGTQGTIKDIKVKIGDTVKKNQILFQLDNYKLENQIQSQETQLKTQRDLARIDLNNVERKFKQTQLLFESGSTSQNEMDQIRDTFNQTKINYNNSSRLYETKMKVLNDDLADTYVKSPINGTIAAVYIEKGEDVGQITAMKVVNDTAMKAVVNLPEKIIRKIKLGQKVEVWFDGEKSKAVEGKVSKVDLTVSQGMSLYPVEITVENTNGNLLSGMFIEVEIHINRKNKVIVIDKRSVLNDGEDNYVFTTNGELSEKKVIKKGIESGEKIEVISGIEKDNLIIVRGHNYLDDKELIQLVE